MMRICRLFSCGLALLCAFLVVAPAGAATGELEAFVLERNGTREDLARLRGHSVDTCLSTPSHLLCVQTQNVPKSHGNPTVQQASLKILAHKVKRSLYAYCFSFVKNTGLRNSAAALDTYIRAADGALPDLTLKGLETVSFAEGDNITAAAAVPLKQSVSSMERNILTKPFADRYCEHLLPKAKAEYHAGQYAEALVSLKEMHDLRWANAEAYILAAHAFLKIGNTADALKIALEVLALLTAQLTPDLAEHLGNIFLELGRDREAEQAYGIALGQGA